MRKSYTGIYSTRLKITSEWEKNPFFSRGTFITSIFKGNELNNMRIIIGFM
ncbi:hypothetical protein [Clostridium beijerinckii]|uniref:hypothetical protein n=1 Tax=Clostridium beijerinckii TaxID=1520 RepID=UPI0005A305E2|nr:hypothetical protein [Clostridium beijerinckii]